MAFRWQADDGPTLNAGLVAFDFKEIRTSIAKEPYVFVIFQGGPDPLSPRWIRTCQLNLKSILNIDRTIVKRQIYQQYFVHCISNVGKCAILEEMAVY